jgi:chitin synthase
MVQDAVTLPPISTMDNGACVELLRGAQLSERSQRKPGGLLGVITKACSSYKSGEDDEQRDEELLKDLTSKYTTHASFIA